MQSADSAAHPSAPTCAPVMTVAARADGMLSTASAALVMGFTQGTLRNYAWLMSLSNRDRKHRGLQDPPEGLPRPVRKRGRLLWPAVEVQRFAQNKVST